MNSNGDGTIVFEPKPGNLEGGEYEAELQISLNGKTQTDFFWFQVRTMIFDAWHDDTFLPGQDIIINVELRNPNGTPLSDRKISVMRCIREIGE
ncbi:MAG TPA: hypothetical protein EYP30_08855 [Archaeoglobaceae archaeon]|nr:hypothetical protein [Archaeoglobaceae archaeon]